MNKFKSINTKDTWFCVMCEDHHPNDLSHLQALLQKKPKLIKEDKPWRPYDE